MLLREAERDSWQEKISTHIQKAARRVDLARYKQEPAYVTAFLSRLDGEVEIIDENETITIEFLPSVIADRGPRSAESKFGADFSIVFSNGKINKAILSQAKRDKITKADAVKLKQQCEKMSRYTDHWVVLKMPAVSGQVPQISFKNDGSDSIPFDVYITDHIISCFHGDRSERFVNVVQDSDLRRLDIIVK
ncbi:hypothetical protein K6U17_18065 [Vibrio fluvialis]|uniref:hypothetical protein n=1 Tax=Vibrio fluvialis TaxID=676 RepID=UPI001EEAD00E|nr:hypothetical protein [Vibrio fluvialis]MCG6411115.1 hypothetical protein [Vibrio fluvialis]